MKNDEPNAPETPGPSQEGPAAPLDAAPFNLASDFPAPASPPPPPPPKNKGGRPRKDAAPAPAKGKPGRPRKDAVKAPPPSAPETLPSWTPPGQEPAPEASPDTGNATPFNAATVEASDLDKNAFRCAKATVTLYCLLLMIWLGEDYEMTDKEKSDLIESGGDFFRLYPGITLFPFLALFLEFAAHFARLMQKPAVRARFFAFVRWVRGEKRLPPPSPHAA
ncbi:MAG: hypothetical protein ACKVPJ_07645 [Chitinophagales bacterium]